MAVTIQLSQAGGKDPMRSGDVPRFKEKETPTPAALLGRCDSRRIHSAPTPDTRAPGATADLCPHWAPSRPRLRHCPCGPVTPAALSRSPRPEAPASQPGGRPCASGERPALTYVRQVTQLGAGPHDQEQKVQDVHGGHHHEENLHSLAGNKTGP